MMRVSALLAVAIFLAVGVPTSIAVESLLPNYKAKAHVAQELSTVERIWSGRGTVIVGRLNLPKDAGVAARIPIHDDGSYCTALYPERRLVFFAHGYDPLEVSQYTEIAGRIHDAGTHAFVKADPGRMRQLRATVTTATQRQNMPPITCVLQVRNREYLWEDHGYRGGAPVVVTVAFKDVRPGHPVEFDRLSRIPYVLVITAAGYIKKELEIGESLDGVIDLGPVTLEPAPTYRFTSKVRVRQDGGDWTGDDSVKRSVVVCDGAHTFRFSDHRDGLGNSLQLRIHPRDGSAEASFFYHQPNCFFRLGAFRAADLPAWDDIDTSTLEGNTNAILQDGQLYFFTIDDINGTGIQMLFQVERE